MEFNINKSIEILANTPEVLKALLSGLSEEWLKGSEGANTWSPYDVLGHLIHGEKTDWIPRAKIILSDSSDKTFVPFDRFAQMNQKEKNIDELLEEFDSLRKANIEELKEFQLNIEDLEKEGIHPELGKVKLKELLATWVTHDLGHLVQISRVMAKQYASEVGPWKAYLGILK